MEHLSAREGRSKAPDRMMITLWDFSWYVRTGAGEPFEDLRVAAEQAVERGYNTIRICAMPFLLFGAGIDTDRLSLEPLGGDYGQGVRWYDVAGPTEIDPLAHLDHLFRVCQEYDLYVIVSSWEYQQSASFASTPAWWDSLRAIPVEERPEQLAQAHARLMDHLKANGLDDRVAYVELHNEVATGHLGDDLPGVGRYDRDEFRILSARLEGAIDTFKAQHPDVPVTWNFARVPVNVMNLLPRNMDVLAVHPYVYGVLDDITENFHLRKPIELLDEPGLREAGILRPEAPPVDEWRPPEECLWKLDATIVAKGEMYVHDWCDPTAFDLYLYERYSLHHNEMYRVLTMWIDVARDYAEEHGIPVVFGEGWVGYTPLRGRFEEGTVGARMCHFAVEESVRINAWGTIVCSNAAPHHPMWEDIQLQRSCSEIFMENRR